MVVIVLAMIALSGPIVDRLPAGDGVADAAIEAPSDRVLDRVARRYQPPPPPLAEPVCLRDPGDACLLWSITDPNLRGAHVVLAGELLVALQRPGQSVTAFRLSDGEVAWTGPRGAPSARQQLATEELLLTVDANGLSARSLSDGAERWRRDELLTDVDLYEARDVGGTVVLHGLAVDARAPADLLVERSDAVLLALDAVTGEDAWRIATVGPAGIAPDGTAVYLATDGRLTAQAPDGTIRWAVDGVDPAVGGGVWVSGRYVNMWRGDGSGEQLHRMADGRPLGFGGTVVASDDDHALLEVWAGPSGPADLVGHGPAYVLLDADDREIWRTPADPSRGCTLTAGFDGDTIRVLTCEQEELVFDRSDGSLLRQSRPRPDTGDLGAPHERMGPFAFAPGTTRRATAPHVLVDTRNGEEVARFPPEAFPLLRERDGPWTSDLGGMAVIQHRGGLTAIALPATPQPSRQGRAR